MKKKESSLWPELVISVGNPNTTQSIRRAAKAGILRKIAPKIYTSNFKDSPETIIKRHRYQILGVLYPGGVISHRSALEGGISSDGSVILSYLYTKTITLPGFIIRLVKGPGPDPEDIPFLEKLYISSRGRAMLENISQSPDKNVSKGELEERLDRIARIYGPEELNRLRDQARAVAGRLKMERAFTLLDKLIGGLLGTRVDSDQQSASGLARGRGEPFDPGRIELFATLMAYLLNEDLPLYKPSTESPESKINLSFFEAYFSNYIEGTIFDIKETENIIFQNKMVLNRPEDSHDILSTFHIVSNKKWMGTVPETAEQLIEILKKRHAFLMEPRADVRPGQFKDVVNRAGNTVFVRPEEVVGTLKKGFDMYQKLPAGICRAIFMMFMISEVHPFIDGNGRIARILMNAELDTANQSRIIIPTVYREDYLLALRRLSRKFDPSAYVRMLTYAQKFTAAFHYEDYHLTLLQYETCNAFLEPGEGKLIIPE